MWVEMFPPLIGFASKKAAQLSAHFLSLQPDMEKLKLIKLVYLSEREFLRLHGHPMIYDEYYSLKDGPICSSALNGMNGGLDQEYWSTFFVLDDNRRNFHLKRKISRDDLDELSAADLEVADSVWDKFSAFTAGQIRKWTHDNCPEYKEVPSGRLPISCRDVMEATGQGDCQHVEDEIMRTRRFASIMEQ
ncbi:MAG: SocA family protein [Proteobacteria bacterium]|nr:SocA family protein [Pseudomonadota bacterium]